MKTPTKVKTEMKMKPKGIIDPVPFAHPIPVKFFRASEKDKYKVTVSISALIPLLPEHLKLDKGREMVLKFVHQSSKDLIPIVFKVNREEATAATNSWPWQFGLPAVGNPVFYKVAEVSNKLNFW